MALCFEVLDFCGLGLLRDFAELIITGHGLQSSDVMIEQNVCKHIFVGQG